MIKISSVNDKSIGSYFVTEYPHNTYIDKTISYIGHTNLQTNEFKMGKIVVYMRDGEQYEFKCYVTGYCSQYGIQVSNNGKYIYVISDEKGLWCYTYKGEIVWKTKYTSVSDVFPHTDNKITCVMSNRIAIIDENGNLIKKVATLGAGGQGKVSDELIASLTSSNILVLFDSMTLEKKFKFSLNKLGLEDFYKANLFDDILTIKGRDINGNYPSYVSLELSKYNIVVK